MKKTLFSRMYQAFLNRMSISKKDRKKALAEFSSNMSEQEAGNIARAYAQGYIDVDRIEDAIHAWLVLEKGFWSRVDRISGCNISNRRND